ncbi:nucleotidyltransferase family protein [Microbacterium mangrovi]|uniref:nucleotidyltransferase family protein n=1 Tax=Microbacterium mangrovi TaxID=1348253 RepID=UPI00068AA8FA|nr:nucleotidyltransferase family protein [Microbacterium mangrovi]
MDTSPADPPATLPIWANVHLTHAALQAVADEAGADVLHIKGPTDAALRTTIHTSMDADVLVRPAHLEAFTAALIGRGWSLSSGFDDGSPFAHAANYEHPAWTWVDVHRAVPGFRMPAGEVFERLWQERTSLEIGHWPCAVPSPRAQVLIQTMHVARSHGSSRPETWTNCPVDLRREVRALAAELRAETAFAAGIGELELHADREDYALWKYWSGDDDDRLGEWIARMRTADSAGARLRTVVRLLQVNRTHLRLRLGHEPQAAEVAREQLSRVGRAFAALGRTLARRYRNRGEREP